MIMQKFLRNTAIFAAVMSMLLFAACTGNNNNGEGTKDENGNGSYVTQPDGEGDSARQAELNQVVARINGLDVPAGFIAFWVTEARTQLDEEITPDSENYEQTVLEKAVRLSAISVILSGYAEEKGIVFSDEDEEDMRSEMEDIMEFYGTEEAFLADYGDIGVQGFAHFSQLIRKFEMMEKVVDAIIESPELFAEFESFMPEEIEEELLAAKHILVFFQEADEEEGIEGKFENEEEAAAFAQELWAKINAGEDFDELMHEHSQDHGLLFYPEGYTFVANAMSPAFEEVTRSLQIGEKSEPFTTEHGTHIVLRTEPDPDGDIHRPPWGGPPSREQRMVSAIVAYFEQRAEEAEIEFLPGLYEIPVELTSIMPFDFGDFDFEDFDFSDFDFEEMPID
jgi:parvulin-like peptidyl-prolyl isomerase